MIRGEVGVPIENPKSMDLRYAFHSIGPNSGRLGSVVLTLLGHEKLVKYKSDDSEIPMRYRDPKKVKQFYKAMGLDVNQSYYDFALQRGFDTARFYK